MFLTDIDTESLTGPQAISKAVQQMFARGLVDTTVATFKVAGDGITVTDTSRKYVTLKCFYIALVIPRNLCVVISLPWSFRLFFRKHFPRDSVSFCGLDPADRRFTQGSAREAKYVTLFSHVKLVWLHYLALACISLVFCCPQPCVILEQMEILC